MSTTDTAALVAFIRARLDEQARVSGSARLMREWRGQPCPICAKPITGWSTTFPPNHVEIDHEHAFVGCVISMEDWLRLFAEGPTDDARWHLADVAAKRAIVDRAVRVLESFENPTTAAWPDVSRRERSHAAKTLHDLASAYADHPDYDEERR